MSYHIYTTKGIILSEWPHREADRTYKVLTRDLGLIHASASGVRKEPSKLRGHIEPLTLSKISLVRGKEYWRLTSAEFIQNIAPSPFIARPLALLEKLVQGEYPHKELFDSVEESINAFDDSEVFEIDLVSKILFHLGYLKESDLGQDKKNLIRNINQGIEASNLT